MAHSLLPREEHDADSASDPPVVVRVMSRVSTHVRAHLAAWCYGLALALWASAWDLRFSSLMAWLPIEPIWLGSLALGVCLVHRLGRPLRVDARALWPLLVLVLGLLPASLRTGSGGYASAKLTSLAFVILPVVVATFLLLDSRRTRSGWAVAQAVTGLAVTVAVITSTGTNVLEPGRFTLPHVDTIATARYIGAGVVALLVLCLTRPRASLWALPLAAVSAAVLVKVGSRGPLLFALMSVLFATALARCFTGRRVRRLLLPAVFAAAMYAYAVADGGSGGQRIVDWLGSGLGDQTRSALFGDAVHLGLHHAWGIGWGGFADASPAGRAIANAQGVAYPHNMFFEAFAEGGIPALLVLAIVIVTALVRLQRRTANPYDAVVLATVVYWFLNAQVSFDLIGNRLMWISLAAALASYVSREDAARVESAMPSGAAERAATEAPVARGNHETDALSARSSPV
ncbi:MAG: O-antigen ligase family protein [Marmoricola sp.]